ncbi:MAG TPA: SDR family oxidoreductase [Methylomirabilota bacterium]|nr:SDR family oxidoreductase [Methylomirabilota bacterium]
MRRRALVTGGAVRVGQAIALALARAGMDVAIGYYRSGRAARRTAAEIGALGARVTVIRANLADPAAAQRLVRQAGRALGGLDVLVNSAAVFDRTPFATTTVARYDRLLGLNLRAAFFCAQAAAALMRRGGHIINIGDAGAAGPRPNYARRGAEAAWILRGALRKVARGHAGSAADVAAAVLFFATCPRYITGQVLKVDGGEGVTS